MARDWREYLRQQEIKTVPIEDVKPYENNPRDNSPAVPAVAASIERFGFRNPILVDGEGVIIEGHTRRLAAIKLGMKEVPVVYATDLTPDEVKALRVIDNKTAELADWDEDVLAGEAELLKDAGFDLEDFGFDPKELEDLLSPGPADGQTDADDVPEVDDSEPVRSKRGEVYVLGAHRLMCGDSTSAEDVRRVCDNGEADLWLTDPPYNVDYHGSDGATIQNDSMSDSKFREFLSSAFECAEKAMKPGAAFYVFHADSEGYNFRGACFDVGLRVRECLVWKKNALVLGRQDYQWIHEPCQPAGTMIRTPFGEVPIESLKDGDLVVSFDTYSGALKGLRDGVRVKTASRTYDGLMYSVGVAGKATRTTENHEFSVRFRPDARRNYCTYLMKRGKWWRVGHTRAYDARQFGLKSRFHQEKAEEAWLLECYETRADAQVAEQKLAVKYGIPYTHWEVSRGFKNVSPNNRTPVQIRELYDGLDLEKMKDNAHRLLREYGRSESFPLFRKGKTSRKMSTRVTCRIAACNLVPDLMQVPIPRGGYGCLDGRMFDWVSINCISFEEFHGRVYSLAVEPWQHYVADGIITHNCLYGWKDGGAHSWYGDRSQTTVMEFNKPKKNDVHPTMKPTEMLVYLIENSTKRGDVVLDTFGGSGSTLVACHQTGRVCRCVEIDPKYCDVIRKRWAEYVHGVGCDWESLTPVCNGGAS